MAHKFTFEEDDSHGSSAWKLALADFMISMMCIFLTLWILQYLDKQDKQELIEMLAPESERIPEIMVLPEKNSVSPVRMDHLATSRYDSDLHRVDHTSLIEGEVSSQQDLQVLAQKVEEAVRGEGKEGAIDVQVTPQGLKITVSDSNEGPMFRSGSNAITPFYQDLLLSMAPTLGNLKNKLVIAGHTDASRYLGSDRTNWDLSTNRANRARHYLQRGGVDRKNFFQITGFAESALLKPNEPRSAENRRIEIVVLTRQAEEQLARVYHTVFDGADIEQDDLDTLSSDAAVDAESNKMLTPFEALQGALNEGA
ncbi:OmpA family protein [Vibrio mediterranei]|uniref:OmpA family protein n=1 Tax=Vibrio mediterranei TaxID=689 RepID=UPI00406841F7